MRNDLRCLGKNRFIEHESRYEYSLNEFIEKFLNKINQTTDVEKMGSIH